MLTSLIFDGSLPTPIGSDNSMHVDFLSDYIS